LEPLGGEVAHYLLESPHLVIAESEVLPNQVVEARLDSQLHICAATPAPTLRDEVLDTAHQ
jgi:hypothetical protein